MFKSDFHKTEFEKFYSTENKYAIIPNGIKVNEFSNNWDNVNRDLYRFCYVSYYTRGLEQILKDTTTTDKQKFEKIMKLFALVAPLAPKLNKIGITHGDLHVSNVMWNPRLKKWQAIDFGLSRRLRKDMDNDESFGISRSPLLKKFLMNYLRSTLLWIS